MKRSTDRILTTHTGSMPRPPSMLDLLRAKEAGDPRFDAAAFERNLTAAVKDTVAKEARAGIDVVNDGEAGKPSFGGYVMERLSGFEPRIPEGGIPVPTGPLGRDGRDASQFPDYYDYVFAHNPFVDTVRVAPRVCTGPIAYVGQQQIQRDIANLKSAMEGLPIEEAFLPAASPIANPSINEHYATAEEFQVAYADAMRSEYQAILDAGLLVQIDDPQMVSAWDAQRNATLDDYRKNAEKRVELLNYALRDLPEDRIRYHTCYGVNFGPRVSDLQLADVVDILFKIRAGSYSFEAANPRHDHEWHLFEELRVPDGKVLIPGMVTHSNVMIEHPELVADRIVRWAGVIGKENLIAGNDCGFASTAGNAEIPMTVAWAKLEALGEGARLASQRLWKN